MSEPLRALVLCLAAALVAGGSGCAGSPPSPAAAPAPPPAPPSTPAQPQQVVPGEYLVTVAPGSDVTAVEQVYGPLGVRRVQVLGGGIVLVVLEKDPGLTRMKQMQAADARLRAVQPNFVYRAIQ